nr:MAG TPA: hypothetical protein [Crassvirales sp.]
MRSPNFMCVSRLTYHRPVFTRFVCAHSGIYESV